MRCDAMRNFDLLENKIESMRKKSNFYEVFFRSFFKNVSFLLKILMSGVLVILNVYYPYGIFRRA